jgi:IS5 family transposase
MRQKWNPQLSIFHTMATHEIAKELAAISEILDDNPEIVALAYKDLVGIADSTTGREGMSAEQVLRSAIVKQHRTMSYEELAFHLEDSHSYRAFTRLKMGQYPGASTLQENITALKPTTWEAMHEVVTRYAASKKFEKGRKVRLDSTTVESNIHYPTDSRLLQDGIRIITRLLVEGKRLSPKPGYRFSDHRRVAKKRLMTIINAKRKKVRQQAYRDLLGVAERVRVYGLEAIEVLGVFSSEEAEQIIRARALKGKLKRALMIFIRVIDQTERRVIHGESVPASEKVVSFFETHTDIIVKGDRETQYGHKVFLTGGGSGLILDCMVVRGNPVDSSMFSQMIERQQALYNRVPRQVAADGGFASQDNLSWAKGEGIQDVMFSKKRGLSVLDMVKSHWVYKRLRNFRAGIEANISRLKRAFAFARCTWRGWVGFQQYVWSTVVSYNLSVLGRLKMATT